MIFPLFSPFFSEVDQSSSAPPLSHPPHSASPSPNYFLSKKCHRSGHRPKVKEEGEEEEEEGEQGCQVGFATDILAMNGYITVLKVC